MGTFAQEILEHTNIPETPNHTLEKVVQFLTEPKSISAMILMTELGQPALAGVVKELEEKFAYSDMPLHFDGPHNNSVNRRNIGWLVKAVMKGVGYTPKKNQTEKEMRLRKFCQTKYFTTSALYEKSDELPNHYVVAKVI